MPFRVFILPHGLVDALFLVHHLRLEVGTPLILLKDLNTNRGFATGTTLVVLHCRQHSLDVEIKSGEYATNTLCLPRINFLCLTPESCGLRCGLISNNGLYSNSFRFVRRQFPVQIAVPVGSDTLDPKRR
jgi:hypothetical protein